MSSFDEEAKTEAVIDLTGETGESDRKRRKGSGGAIHRSRNSEKTVGLLTPVEVKKGVKEGFESRPAPKPVKKDLDFSKYRTFSDSPGFAAQNRDEVDTYLSLAPPPSTKTVLEVWKGYKDTLSKLHMLAMKILATQAGSTPSERLFSDAGNIFTDKRSLLGSDKLDDLLFLKWNL